MKSAIDKKWTACPHNRVHEIGQDCDKDGNLLRLVRCQECGLLMREYFSTPAMGIVELGAPVKPVLSSNRERSLNDPFSTLRHFTHYAYTYNRSRRE